MDSENKDKAGSRRDFLRKLAYIPPAIVTLTVLPAFHASGSGLTTTPGGGNTQPHNGQNDNRRWSRPWNRNGRDR